MSNGGVGDAKAQNTMASGNETADQGAFNNDMGMYMSNVNSQIAAGNPFESQPYKTEQNLATSGAMHSTNDAATQQQRAVAQRTGQNANAIAASSAENAQKGAMSLDNYNANRDTENENSWLQDQAGLTHDQLAGADAVNSNEGLAANQADATSGQLIQQQDSEDQMWAGLGEAAMGDAQKGLTAAFAPAP